MDSTLPLWDAAGTLIWLQLWLQLSSAKKVTTLVINPIRSIDMSKCDNVISRRNPVARATLLRKGGVHQKSKSAERHKNRQALRREVRSMPTSCHPLLYAA
jgi:hypothetical protein